MKHLQLLAVVVLLAGLQAPAQTILGKHPADKWVLPWWTQNGNANLALDGLSAYGTHSLTLAGGLVTPTITLGGVARTNLAEWGRDDWGFDFAAGQRDVHVADRAYDELFAGQ